MEVDRADTVAEEATDVTQEISLNTSAEEDAAIEHRKQKLREEITELEDDIRTLKQAVARKEAHLVELKKELGVTRWSQFRDGVSQKYQAYQSTQMYNKISTASSSTKQTLDAAGEKTSAAFKSLGSATAKKWNDIRESSTFHSMEEKMWATTGAIKAKVSGQKNETASIQPENGNVVKADVSSAI